MTSKTTILVGPKPRDESSQHPGGQLTAAMGIIKYAKEQSCHFDIIDTLMVSFPPPSFGERLKLSLGRVLSLIKKLSGDEINGVIIFVGARHSFFERVFLSALARIYRARTLFCIRDGSFLDWMRSSNTTYWLVRRLLRIPDCIVVQGTRFENALVGAGVPRERLAVVHNWLPEAFEIVTQPKGVGAGTPLKLIFVGWLVKEKGIQELLDAVVDLKSRYQVTLDIIGGGTLETELRQKVSNLSLNNVHVHGWMSPLEIQNFLDRAHVFVLPTYFEGFPNGLLEAMARGLPAVCSDVGAISDSIHDGVNGFLVPPKNLSALTEGIENYLKNPQLVLEHSTATLEVVKRMHDRDSNLAELFSLLS